MYIEEKYICKIKCIPVNKAIVNKEKIIMKKDFVKLIIICLIVFSCVFTFIYSLNPTYGLTSKQLKNHHNLTAEETIKLYAYYSNRNDFDNMYGLLSSKLIQQLKTYDVNTGDSNPSFLIKIEKVDEESNSNGLYKQSFYETYWDSSLLIKLGYKPSCDDLCPIDMVLVKEKKNSDWVIQSIGF